MYTFNFIASVFIQCVNRLILILIDKLSRLEIEIEINSLFFLYDRLSTYHTSFAKRNVLKKKKKSKWFLVQ